MEGRDPRQDGFALLELLAVITIIAILVSVAIPSLLANRRQAREMETKIDLTNAAKVVAALEPRLGGYTDDAVLLEAASHGVDFSGTEPRSIHVVAGDVQPGDDGQVLLYARSMTGRWFGLRMVLLGEEAGRHTCIGNEDDMQLAACVGTRW